MNPEQLQSIPAKDANVQLPVRKSRHSLTIRSARPFKDSFDKAIKTQEDVFIPLSAAPKWSSLGTLLVKSREALLYFSRHFEKPENLPGNTKEDYIKLKEKIKICEVQGGVLIHFAEKSLLSEVSPIIDESWKTGFINFLDDPTRTLFRITDLNLSEEDINWIKELAIGNGFEHEVNKTTIVIAK